MKRAFQTLYQAFGSDDSTLSEPSEQRLRTIALACAMMFVPPLLLFIYYKAVFPGLTISDALDFAQLGRNMSSGHGFTTYILRPIGLTESARALQQPDVTHGPLYPFLLALAFGILGAKDTAVSLVSGIFYLASVPVIYILGKEVFNRLVGLISATIFTFSGLMLEYAISGTHITLNIFLTALLFLAIHRLAEKSHTSTASRSLASVRGSLLAAGALTGLLYLSDPIFIWFAPAVVITVIGISHPQRLQATSLFLLPFLLLAAPWMIRNTMLAGNPIFGLRGLELIMNTKTFPDYQAYRLTPDELTSEAGLLQAVLRKLVSGIGQAVETLPQISISWILAFFLPSLLFRFSNSATHTLRRITVSCFLLLLLGSVAFSLDPPLLVATVPGMLIFAVAFLVHLTRQAQLNRRSIGVLATSLMVVLGYPLVNSVLLNERPAKLDAAVSAQNLAIRMGPRDICLSDRPDIVAWYADRPCLWIPAHETKVKQVVSKLGSVRWLMLTQAVNGTSPEWTRLYQSLYGWNLTYAQAMRGAQPVPNYAQLTLPSSSVLDVFNGFATLEPVEGADLTVVVAGLEKGPRVSKSQSP